jgi:hypothetical protein
MEQLLPQQSEFSLNITLINNFMLSPDGKRLTDKINNVLKGDVPFNTLVGFIKNPSLCNKILFELTAGYSSEEQKTYVFYNVPETLAHIRDNPDKIIIYFQELYLYVVFAVARYQVFVAALFDKTPTLDIITHQQIILTGIPQKLVLICKDNMAGEDVINQIISYFLTTNYKITQSRISDCKVELTLPSVQNTYSEIAEEYERIKSVAIGNNKIYDLLKSIKLAEPITNTTTGLKYNSYNIDFTKEGFDRDEFKHILMMLKTCPTINNLTINCGTTNNTNNNCNIGDHNRNTIKVINRENTKRWVEEAPPNYFEISNNYYNKYKTNNPDSVIGRNEFGKIMTELGYKNTKSGTERYYRK